MQFITTLNKPYGNTYVFAVIFDHVKDESSIHERETILHEECQACVEALHQDKVLQYKRYIWDDTVSK